MLILFDTKLDMSAVPKTAKVYTWNGVEDTAQSFSLLNYIEHHATRLKRQYLDFTDALGKKSINGKCIIDHLLSGDGLSYWWVTSFAEKHYARLPFVDVLRLIALIEILNQEKPEKFVLVSANKALHKVLKPWCKSHAINYQWKKKTVYSPSWSKQHFFLVLPQTVQGLLGLVRYIRKYSKFTSAPRPAWFRENAIFICGYFANIDIERANKGCFHSKYWEGLHGLLRELNLSPNWLHHNADHIKIKSMNWLEHFNARRKSEGAHAFLESYFSWPIVINVLKGWLDLHLAAWRMRGVKTLFTLPESDLSVWPLMKKNWHDSLKGVTAINNLLSIKLFDVALSGIPHQKMGLYLYENHAWEYALIHAWKKYQHGQLAGVQHATVRFWDLRYFTTSQVLVQSAAYNMPMPHMFILNQTSVYEAYLDMHYPKERLRLCEALRYNYLDKKRPERGFSGVKRSSKRLLILGDISEAVTRNMLQVLGAALSIGAPVKFECILKAHPTNELPRDGQYTTLNLKQVKAPLEDLLEYCDVVYASDSTSAAVDAYCWGVPVIILSRYDCLSLSPLRGMPEVYFVNSAEGLLKWLKLLITSFSPHLPKTIFETNESLPKWRELLTSIVLN